jgi:hypothetical protein
MTIHECHTSFTNTHSSNKTQRQQTRATGSKDNTHTSAADPIEGRNTPRADFINNAHGRQGTDGELECRHLTQQPLAVHQNELSCFHADPNLVLAAQQAQQARLEAAARTLDFDLPASATRNYTGMTRVGRYMAEQVDGEGPWTGMTRRR